MNEQFLDSIISSVINAIVVMSQINFYHGDLHCGNVFLVSRGGQNTIVLGDFGESQIDNDSINNSEGDFYKFISTFRQQLSYKQQYRYYLAKIERILNVYRAEGRQVEVDFDDYLEQGYKTEEAVKLCNVNFINTIAAEWQNILNKRG
jgi:tRNA A-37 threonylcarbamoyl transferase component Bud32